MRNDGPDHDETLMLAYQAGDAGAFDTLYQRHRGRLFRFLVREAGSHEAGEEIYQEAWLRLIRHREEYRVEARFSTYLYRLAHSALIDHLRKRGRLWKHEETVEELPDDIACPLPGPETAWGQRLTAQALSDCLQTLPEEQREVFLLREEAELSLADIAEITGAGLEAAKSRLRYALKKLRLCLEAREVLT
ncbi:MAG: sigma-70 family RNA polymerase sigma factor [Methylobacillus sp.]|jgi:RNA polymerase sigma-70 factor (ECF subfamily)|nr:sigma-70 family RNA polymerase sigma factor [Methylobacillus sp.]